MKTRFPYRCVSVLALAVFLFTANNVRARLPKSIQIQVTAVFVDQETQTVVAKLSEPTRKPKPFVLDWNEDTQFIKNGEEAKAVEFKRYIAATIHYKRVSFKNPLLKKVVWEDKPDAK